jgi:glycosyltransferase involved in cell wall biosynthesis
MNIVVAVRCYNEERHVERFLRGYSFADKIVISDGGSTDRSVDIIKNHPDYGSKIQLLNFEHQVEVNGHLWNEDAPHMNFVLDAAKELKPDILLFDDCDDVPNALLRNDARAILESCKMPQINAFRLYLWGDEKYFPWMNRGFDPAYRSVWGWRPSEVDIHADPNVHHGTLVGLTSNWGLDIPYCLLHKSYSPETIDAKLERYNALGLTMYHPLETNGPLKDLPEWASE